MPARVRSAVHHHRYCTLRFALHWLRSSVNPRSLSPLTDVDITYGPISPVFLSSAMVKMCVFVDWACTFFQGWGHDSLSSLYGICSYFDFNLEMGCYGGPGPLIFAIPTTDWRCVDFLTPRSNTILTKYGIVHCLTPACLKQQSDWAWHRLNVDSCQTCIIYNN